jgi:hypothetical protein
VFLDFSVKKAPLHPLRKAISDISFTNGSFTALIAAQTPSLEILRSHQAKSKICHGMSCGAYVVTPQNNGELETL